MNVSEYPVVYGERGTRLRVSVRYPVVRTGGEIVMDRTGTGVGV